MSVQALNWVLEECPDLPKHLVALMMGLANHADPEGRGAYPSQARLAWYTRKEERSVRRDLDEAEQLGLIRRGDQRMVLHLDVDRRPVVWDLAVELKRDPRCGPGRRGAAGKRGDVHVPPDGERGDVHVRNGGTSTSDRGDVHVPQTVHEPSKEPSTGGTLPPDPLRRPSPPAPSTDRNTHAKRTHHPAKPLQSDPLPRTRARAAPSRPQPPRNTRGTSG